MGTRSRPGKEIPPDYKKVVNHLIDTQGWRYEFSGNYPRLYPEDRSQGFITIVKTPSSQRSYRNFLAKVKGAGGVWPPEGKGSGRG